MQVFTVAAGAREGCEVLVVCGEVDEVTAPALEDAIEGCPAGWPLVVDISGVQFISSAGLHVLLKERPERVVLVCPPGNVARLFEIVRANQSIRLFDSLDYAVESLTHSRSA